MKKKKYLVTGGTGFIGSALVKRLIQENFDVRVFDNNLRGHVARLTDIKDEIEYIQGDITSLDDVLRACQGIDSVIHLAYLNGTEFFYTKPHLVLEIGVKGIVNVLDACRDNGIKELILASSSEVYQEPKNIPTDERVAYSIPDPLNPRYSYAGGKIISELMVINYGRHFFDRAIIFRPHNVYGPDMGHEHVIPQLVQKIMNLSTHHNSNGISLPIQGSGQETRSFIFIHDFIEGLISILMKGRHLEIYNIGTQDEVTIKHLAETMGKLMHKNILIQTGVKKQGSAARRCPDITKIKNLGFEPKFSLEQGLLHTIPWYKEIYMQKEENSFKRSEIYEQSRTE